MTESHDPKLNCALVGADSLLIECGELLLAGGHDIGVVAAGSDRVARWATGHGLAVIDATRPVSTWGAELASHAFDWLFAITHLALLPDDVVAQARQGAINFHDGPLPGYGGLNAPAWALMAGEQTYGISWHQITPGIDEGPVYATVDFDVADRETSLSLNTRNFEAAIDSFRVLVDDLAAGTAVAVAQPEGTRRTFSRHDRPGGMAVLDWDRSATEVDRLVRALTFGPYPNPLALPKVGGAGQVLYVTETLVVDDPDDAAPGTVIAVDDDRLVVACADGALALTGFMTDDGECSATDAASRLDARVGGSLAAAGDVLQRAAQMA